MSHDISFDDEITIEHALGQVTRHGAAIDATGLRVTILGAGFGTPASVVLRKNPKARVLVIEPDRDELHAAERQTFPPTATYAAFGIEEAVTRVVHEHGRTELLLYCASTDRQQVFRDLRAWLPWCEPYAIIWVHGFGASPQSYGLPDMPDIPLAVSDLVAGGWMRELVRVGTAWIGSPAGEQPPGPILWGAPQ